MQQRKSGFGGSWISGRAKKPAARSAFLVIGLMSGVLAGFADSACGQCEINETAKIMALDGAYEDHFGLGVVMDGDVLVIGAEGDDDNGSFSGSVYVYGHDGVGWVEQQKLLAQDGVEGDCFGSTVAMDGDTLVVGACGDDDNGDNSGSAYVFRHDGTAWIAEAKLLASDGVVEDFFGASVAIDGDVVIVGAPGRYWDPIVGSAYIFRFDGSVWVEEAKIVPPDGGPGDQFGVSVALEGDTAMIGAGDHEVGGEEEAGAVYVYRDQGAAWLMEAKLTASDADKDDAFGCAVAIDGDQMLVGADRHSDNEGRAYLFSYDGSSWTEEAIFAPSDGWDTFFFGCSVAIEGDVVAMLAEVTNDDGYDSNSVYLYRFDGTAWGEETMLLPSDGFDEEHAWGGCVSLSEDVLVAGIFRADGNDTRSGAAYLVEGVHAAIEDCDQEPWVPEYNVIDLGTLGGGSCFPQAINDAGQVVGYSEDEFFQIRAFLWEDGVMTDLAGLPGYIESYALDINTHGQIVGYSSFGDWDWHATLWDGDQIIDLGTLGGEDSQAYGINDDSRIVGWAQTDEGDRRAFMYQNDEMIDIGRDWPDRPSEAAAVNSEGNIAGRVVIEFPYEFFCGSADGFINDDGDITMLWNTSQWSEFLPRSTDINNNDLVVGNTVWAFYMDCNGSQTNGWCWTPGKARGAEWLPAPVEGYGQSWAYGINDSADIVGGATDAFKSDYIAVRWRGDDGADLDDLIPEDADVQLRMAYGINNAGQVVCIDEYARGFLLNPNVYGDVNGDLVVDIDDIFAVLAAWGPCDDPDNCPADLNGDGTVDIDDLFEVLANWT